MVATLVAFVAVRIFMEESARPSYLTASSRITDPGTKQLPTTDWTVSNGWIDSSGRVLAESEKTALLRQISQTGGGTEQYMTEHGLRHYTEFHPDSNLGAFQAIEAGWFVGLAAVLLATTIWIVRRRTT